MQRGRVLNLSKYQVLSFLKANSYFLSAFLFLGIGVVFGLIFFDDFKIISYFLERFFTDFISLRRDGSFLKIVISSFIKSIFIFLFLFISGTSLFGVVTVPLMLSFSGFFYGCAVAYLYSSYALKGVAFNAVIFLPSSIILILFMVFAARHAMIFSLGIAKLTLPASLGGDLFLQFKDFSLKFLFITLGSISAALVDGLTAISMLKFFEF